MRETALFAILLALLLPACSEEERALSGRDPLDSSYLAECAPGADEGVLHAWKDGKRYCFRYSLERVKPRRAGPAVIIARSGVAQTT